jgi:glycosyltransferase involved in cell wall biosynthesis
MNVVHVNTHDSGGAAVAAHRLHRSLMDYGVDSKFLVLFNSGKFPDAETFSQPKRSFLLKKIKNKILGNPSKEIQKLLLETKEVEMFSSPNTLYDLAANPIVRRADIIHLHWVSNFLDYGTFFKTIGKPIVWTFHDENPFMGGCHYYEDAQFLPKALLSKENAFRDLKITSLKGLNTLDVICPSHWMRRKVAGSFYDKYSVHTLFYGLDENEFKYIERNEARRRLKLNNDHLVLCAIATDLKTYRKGFDIVLSLMDFICSLSNITLLLVGALPQVSLPDNVIQIGELDDREKLNLVYSASDALLFPSRQDNLPNVLIESLFCGTPALGFAVGGVPEIIQNGLNGLLADDVSVQSFEKLIKMFLSRKVSFNRNEIRAQAFQKFSAKNQAARVTNLYEESSNKPR